MKTLVNFINESKKRTTETYINRRGKHIVNDNKYVRIGDKASIYKNVSLKYLNLLGQENVENIIKNALENTNTVLEKICNSVKDFIDPSPFLTGHIIGRIFEATLANGFINTSIEGFKFSHGKENATDKDIICENIPQKMLDKFPFTDDEIEYIKYNWQGPKRKNDNFFKTSEYFGFEIKTSMERGATGNKSYAADIFDENSVKKFKDRSSFYFIMNYTPINKDKIIQINKCTVYFGFLDQSDWIFYKSAGISKINTKLLNVENENGRFIKIYNINN